MTQDRVLSHQKIPMFWTWDLPLFRPLKSAIWCQRVFTVQLMDCSYVIAFSHQNDWTSKCHYKALDVTVNQRIIPSVGIFKEFGGKVALL